MMDIILNQLNPLDCPCCGDKNTLISFCNKELKIQVGNKNQIVKHLFGTECNTCKEVFLTDESALRYSEIGDKLVMEARKKEFKGKKKTKLK